MKNRKSKTPLVLIVSLIATFSLSPAAQAQTNPRKESVVEQDENKPKTTTTTLGMLENSQALEKAIEADAYLVGPGDVFLIQIIGPISEIHQTVVTPEGKLIIPKFGNFEVDQQTLAAVQKQVQEAGKRLFNLTTITTDLIRMRSIRIHVAGQVAEPGTYIATPVDRITDMLNLAGGFTTWAATEAIEIRHADRSIDYFNYSSYRVNASLSTNIHVRAGDVIFAPPVDLAKPYVYLESDRVSKGVYQIKPGENIEDFLLRIGVMHSNIDFQHAILVRQQDKGGTGTQKVFLLPALLAESQNGNTDAQLKNEDRIILSSGNNNVYVRGAVRNPGAFIFLSNLKVQDYVGLAGGTVGAAKGSYVVRDGKKHDDKLFPLRPGDMVVVPQNIRTQFIEYFAIVSQIATIIIAIKALQQ